VSEGETVKWWTSLTRFGPALAAGAAVALATLGLRQLPRPEPPSVAWPTAAPSAEGLDPDALRRMRDELAARKTKALLVARHGRIVFEWYAHRWSDNRRHYTAAEAKGLTAAPTLALLAGEGRLSLDDPVSKWVPEWAADPVRSRITLRDLAFHRSGLENVKFKSGQAGDLPDWKQRYYDHPDERYRLAIDSARVLFPPGTRFGYSGVGYYVLSYVATRALQGSPQPDIPAALGNGVLSPIGIPRSAWSIGYGRSDTVDGMRLTHFGSGGELTARAAARIGQLFLQRGCWKERRVLDPEIVDTMLGRHGYTPDVAADGSVAGPASGGGWWLNVDGAWPDAPADAVAAFGNGHEVVVLYPGLDVVAVRFGEDLAAPGETFQEALDRWFLGPLAEAVKDPEPLRPGSGRVAGSPQARRASSGSCPS
jgi:CubicO group peptidase (beta-lactamase class C family)